jgi:hypothetical protein
MSINVFFSYSHKDEAFKEDLQTHLSILKRQGSITSWDDRRISPGDKWEEEINLNLQKADIILLLVSSNFLASDYCYETETIFALEQHNANKCTVIPIIIKPCLFEQSCFKGLQALPKNAKAVSTWENADLAWLDVTQGILKAVNNVKNKVQPIDDIIQSLNEQKIPEVENLSDCIMRFLCTYKSFYFSPLRIQKWGGNQKSFSVLREHSPDEIRIKLDELLKTQKVRTVISKLGNTIYKGIQCS